MARVESFRRGVKQRPLRHDLVEAEVSLFTTDDGERILQIDTFGSPLRKRKGKVSQSIQMTVATFEVLVGLVRDELRGP